MGNEADRRSRLIEIALAVRDRWTERAALDEELLALGPPRLLPKGAIERLDALNARVQKHRQKMEKFGRLRRSLRREFRNCPSTNRCGGKRRRIEALTGTAAVDGAVAEPDRGIGSRNRRLGDGVGR